MIARIVAAIVLAFVPPIARGQLGFGTAQQIDGGWKFTLGETPAAAQPDFNDETWRTVDLPHDWSIESSPDSNLASCAGYLPGGIGWYRKILDLPAAVKDGEKVFLYFEGVYNRSEVYFNGHLLGKRPNGFVSFYYDATPFVNLAGKNVVAVRVDHSRAADARWYTGSGIYRNVYVVRSAAVHLAPWGVVVRTPRAEASGATLQIETEVQNQSDQPIELSVRQELFAEDGKSVAKAISQRTVHAQSANSCDSSLDVRTPHLWSLQEPHLYRLITTVLAKGTPDHPIDQANTRVGLRSIAFDPAKGFSLNGENMKLKGVCIHHEAGVLGVAVPENVLRKRLQTLKSIGCNAIRLSHNPQAPILYDLCDELGLLVMDEAFDEWEFPKRKWLRGWNVGEPGFESSTDFFAEWSGRDVADMVKRDRNHPSVFAWSIGNEIDYPNDPYSHPVLDQARINQPMLPGYKPDHPDAKRLGPIAQRLAVDVRKLDPTRPVTAALAGVVMSSETDYPGALDIVGYNYTEDRYAQDHQRYPKRVIYGSENGHSYKAWRAVVENDFIAGQFLWTGIDYLGEAGPWPARGSRSGLLDLTGAVKPRGRFRQALWSERPLIFLGTEAVEDPSAKLDSKKPPRKPSAIDAYPIWNYAAGQNIRVYAYTNADRARLLLNGQPVGGPQALDPETGMIVWEIPFSSGKLEAIGLDKTDTEITRAEVRTATAAAKLLITANEKASTANGVTTIALQVVDAQEVPVLIDERRVSCTIDGPAKLLGLEASDNQDMSNARDTSRKTYHGRIVAYIQALGSSGEIKVKFTAPGLPDASVAFHAE